MKQTAVEFLIKAFQGAYGESVINVISVQVEQAKQIEKEQIIESYRDGRSDQQSERQSKFYNRTAEQYYQEIFKKD
jgi:RNA binding exosome subunit